MEGGGDTALCKCGAAALWRCLTCVGRRPSCGRCLAQEHNAHPLHRVEFWNGKHYTGAWLRSLNVRVHLGHGGAKCPQEQGGVLGRHGQGLNGRYGQAGRNEGMMSGHHSEGRRMAESSPTEDEGYVFSFTHSIRGSSYGDTSSLPTTPSAASKTYPTPPQSGQAMARLPRARRDQADRYNGPPPKLARTLPHLKLNINVLPGIIEETLSENATEAARVFQLATAEAMLPSPASPLPCSTLSSPALPPSSPEDAETEASLPGSPTLVQLQPLLLETHLHDAPGEPGSLQTDDSDSRHTAPSRSHPLPTATSIAERLPSHSRIALGKRAVEEDSPEARQRRMRPWSGQPASSAAADEDESEDIPVDEDDEFAESRYGPQDQDEPPLPHVGKEVLTPAGQGRPQCRMIVFVDTSGVHEIPVVFCTCIDAEPVDIQLLRMGLYPATTRRPKTAFTFRVLDDFLLTNKECQTAAMNYYSKLRRITNDAFPHMVPVSPSTGHFENVWPTYCQDQYRDLLRVSRQWRNLKARKMTGIGYSDNLTPGKGSFAIRCPACPRPGKNMADGWQTDPHP